MVLAFMLRFIFAAALSPDPETGTTLERCSFAGVTIPSSCMRCSQMAPSRLLLVSPWCLALNEGGTVGHNSFVEEYSWMW